MRLIPVLDLLNGIVVHAVGGRREAYQPVRSRLTSSVDPCEVGAALLQAANARELYVADLDAILGRGSNLATIRELGRFARVYADLGLRTQADLDALPLDGNFIPVLGSETLEGPEIAAGAQEFEGEVVFSVDLRDGDLMGPWDRWVDYQVTHPRAVAELARAGYALSGARTVLLVDVGRVGTARGPTSEEECRAVRAALPREVELLVGGGIRTWEQIHRLEEAGADAVLIASALHDGALRPS